MPLRGGVGRAQLPGPLVDVDGPHRRRRARAGPSSARSRRRRSRGRGRSPVGGGGGALRSSSSRARRRARPWLNTPRSVRQRERHVGQRHARRRSVADGDRRVLGRSSASMLASVAWHAWPNQIRTFGDPVLKTKARPVADIDGKARPPRRRHVRHPVRRPTTASPSPPRRSACRSRSSCGTSARTRRRSSTREIVESDGEWVYEEGCLSIPGLYVEMRAPEDGARARRRPRRRRGRDRGRRARGAACSSTSSTTSTAC